MISDFDSDYLNKFHRVRHIHAENILKKYQHLLQWKSQECVLDVGCGTGDLTKKYLLPLLPQDYAQYVCSDLSKDLLKQAEKTLNSNPKVSFKVLDIVADLPNTETAKYSKIFSLFCFMWISDQEKAFQNVYDLLTPNGACLHVFSGTNPVMRIILELTERSRWKKYFPNPKETYPFPYMNNLNSVETIMNMMTSIGYVNVKVYEEKSAFTYRTKEEYLGFLNALPNPMALMTPDERRDYQDEAVELAKKCNVINEVGDRETYNTLLVVYGEKISPIPPITK